jgi:RNA-binding protein 5/10
MMRQLPLSMDDYELKNQLTIHGVPFKDIRLVKNRDTGASRGFAFIEFGTIEEAQAWMNQTQVISVYYY